MDVDVEDPAPDFSLLDQNGDPWTLSNHWGSPVVIYFYPAANTPDCTTQACQVRDSWIEFLSLGAAVVGISPDDVDTIARFVSEHDLPHRLLSDPDASVIKSYGAWGEKEEADGSVVEGVIRSSVIINRDGEIAEVFPTIDPEEQASKVLAIAPDVAG